MSELWTALNLHAHPGDVPLPAAWETYYDTLHRIVAERSPRRIVEIGVRAGYSSFAMLLASPHARIIGFDADWDHTVHNSHGGRKSYWQHAVKILPPDRFDLILVDSQRLLRLPDADLIYVDGDHSLDGCRSDLQLASQSTRAMLVDDYDVPCGVAEACAQFIRENPQWTGERITNGLTGFFLLTREV